MGNREMARALGRRGGRARARRLTAEARSRIASLGGEARALSLRTARLVADNLRYAEAALELRGSSQAVARMKAFEGPLPGIYAHQSGA